jgi:hypothetical protein
MSVEPLPSYARRIMTMRPWRPVRWRHRHLGNFQKNMEQKVSGPSYKMAGPTRLAQSSLSTTFDRQEDLMYSTKAIIIHAAFFIEPAR